MPDPKIRTADGEDVPILTDDVTTHNGVAVDEGTQVQAVGIATLDGSQTATVGGENPLPTADYTPLPGALTPGGLDVDPNTPTLIAPAVGRLFIVVNLLDTDVNGDPVAADAKLWLGYGVPAVEGRGDWIAFNGRTDPTYYAGDVHVLLTGSDTAVRVTWQEWTT